MIGKPDSGKLTVRFDEGELEIEPFGYYASSLLYSTVAVNRLRFIAHFDCIHSLKVYFSSDSIPRHLLAMRH